MPERTALHAAKTTPRLTLTPRMLVPTTITRDVLRPLLLVLLLVGSKHVLEEVELSLGDGDQHQKCPNSVANISQHIE